MKRLWLLGVLSLVIFTALPASASALPRYCGTVPMLDFTRAEVEANRYVASCRKARRIARHWSRYQPADNGINPMIKFSSPFTNTGFPV